MVLDMTVRGEHQRLAAPHGRQRGEMLGGDAVQPGQPVHAGDAQHSAVRTVDDHRAVLADALLAQRIPVVVSDPEVGSGGGHGTGDGQQW